MFELATCVSGSSNAVLFETRNARSWPGDQNRQVVNGLLWLGRTLEIGYAPIPTLERHLLRLKCDAEVLFEKMRKTVMVLCMTVRSFQGKAQEQR